MDVLYPLAAGLVRCVYIYLATFGIDYDAITKEQFVNLMEVLKLSKYMKSSTNQRGKTRSYQPHGKGKRKHK